MRPKLVGQENGVLPLEATMTADYRSSADGDDELRRKAKGDNG
jgi:hypothetical protein